MWKSPASYRPGTVAAWLLTVVRYRAIDLARRNARHEVGCAGGELTELCAGTEDVIDRAISHDDAHNSGPHCPIYPRSSRR